MARGWQIFAFQITRRLLPSSFHSRFVKESLAILVRTWSCLYTWRVTLSLFFLVKPWTFRLSALRLPSSHFSCWKGGMSRRHSSPWNPIIKCIIIDIDKALFINKSLFSISISSIFPNVSTSLLGVPPELVSKISRPFSQPVVLSHFELKSQASHWIALAGKALMSVGVIPA